MSKIIINSKKLKEGEYLTCIKDMVVLLTPGQKYKIIKIRDVDIMMMDNDNDPNFPISLSMDKTQQPNIFEYFELW